MVLILDGNSEHNAHAFKKNRSFRIKNPICDYSRSDKIPETDQITEIAPYVRTYVLVTI